MCHLLLDYAVYQKKLNVIQVNHIPHKLPLPSLQSKLHIHLKAEPFKFSDGKLHPTRKELLHFSSTGKSWQTYLLLKVCEI
jgi:hypothetical protein